MVLNRVRAADCFTSQSLKVGAERQVVTFNVLDEYFTGQMLILWLLPAIAAQSSLVIIAIPVADGQKALMDKCSLESRVQ